MNPRARNATLLAALLHLAVFLLLGLVSLQEESAMIRAALPSTENTSRASSVEQASLLPLPSHQADRPTRPAETSFASNRQPCRGSSGEA